MKQYSAQRKAQQLHIAFKNMRIYLSGGHQWKGVQTWKIEWDKPEVWKVKYGKGKWETDSYGCPIEGKSPGKVIAMGFDHMRKLGVWRNADGSVWRWDDANFIVESIQPGSEHYPKEASVEAEQAKADPWAWPPKAHIKMPAQYSKVTEVTLDGDMNSIMIDGETITNEETLSILKLVHAYDEAGLKMSGTLSAKWKVLKKAGFSLLSNGGDVATIEDIAMANMVTNKMNEWATNY